MLDPVRHRKHKSMSTRGSPRHSMGGVGGGVTVNQLLANSFSIDSIRIMPCFNNQGLDTGQWPTFPLLYCIAEHVCTYSCVHRGISMNYSIQCVICFYYGWIRVCVVCPWLVCSLQSCSYQLIRQVVRNVFAINGQREQTDHWFPFRKVFSFCQWKLHCFCILTCCSLLNRWFQ